MIGCLSMQALAFLAGFVYATQAIAFEWKPGLTIVRDSSYLNVILFTLKQSHLS